MKNEKNTALETRLTHLGRHPDEQFGAVNTPVFRASTILHPDLETLFTYDQPYVYGRRGTPSSRGVEEIITSLEGGKGTRVAPSGLSALTCAIMSVVSSGDEILVTDSAYEPTRQFCDGYLSRMGVTTRYFNPRVGEDFSKLITDKTRAIFLESPGSLTLELQDIPAIAKARDDTVSRRNSSSGSASSGSNIAIIVDNTWATPLFYQPLSLGADIVIHAGTKMFVGHSDAMFGTMTANEIYWPKLDNMHGLLGLFAGPDDCFLATRGLRTLSIRMQAHQERALNMATWLEGHDLVQRVLHPALPSHPDHGIFKRDFSGSGCLFSFTLPAASRKALASFVDHMELFGLGYSWGGFESLILPGKLGKARSINPWPEEEQLIRLHIGLEDIDELKQDIAAGIERYRAAM